MNGTAPMFKSCDTFVMPLSLRTSQALSVTAYQDKAVLITALRHTDELPRLLSTALSQISPEEKIIVDARSIHLNAELVNTLLLHGRGGNRTIVVAPQGFAKISATRVIDEQGRGLIDQFSWDVTSHMNPPSGALDVTRSQDLREAVDSEYARTLERPLSNLVTPIARSVDVREFATISESGDKMIVKVHRTVATNAERAALGALLRDTVILPLSTACVLDLSQTDAANGSLCGEIVTACRWRKQNGAAWPLHIRVPSSRNPTFNHALGSKAGFTMEDGDVPLL